MVDRGQIRTVITVNPYKKTMAITASYICVCGTTESLLTEFDEALPEMVKIKVMDDIVTQVQQAIERQCWCEYYEEIPRRIL